MRKFGLSADSSAPTGQLLSVIAEVMVRDMRTRLPRILTSYHLSACLVARSEVEKKMVLVYLLFRYILNIDDKFHSTERPSEGKYLPFKIVLFVRVLNTTFETRFLHSATALHFFENFTVKTEIKHNKISFYAVHIEISYSFTNWSKTS
ncbi:hypothetical protein AVEN_152983-1 [Araneus ventricosus]|uniref:Uncharacterized protein n=1 Tax=Araneus ventricosus TaxID=182803 RepID=A0A4Y2AEW9_ARAVE|nr:hypothetical protein AVEN_152983-1 [Araneus ventricosus]